jgi:hypothetical protein
MTIRLDEKEIRKKIERIRSRLYDRRMNMDASGRLAFGLCKKYGIELPPDAGPKEAWEALKEKTGKSSMDFYRESGYKGSDKVKFNTSTPKNFVKKLAEAKKSQDPRKGWRVTGLSKDELEDWHPDAKLHVTDGGSTIAIDKGDIVGVCVGSGDGKGGFISGSMLLDFAVRNGGNKLDSYEGNHVFYTKSGFEPVSWCEWDPTYEDSAREQGWDPDKGDKREAIIFYKYVGKGNVKFSGEDGLEAFKKSVPVSNGYDEAKEHRNSSMKG